MLVDLLFHDGFALGSFPAKFAVPAISAKAFFVDQLEQSA
jgi:hypothetical protein